MKTATFWAVACRVNKPGKPWHLGFSRELFNTYEEASKKAFEFNEDPAGGYLHKPVQVTVAASPAQQGGAEDKCGATPARFLPTWDGLFTTGFGVYDINKSGVDMFIESIEGTLSLREVGLTPQTLMEAVYVGYAV